MNDTLQSFLEQHATRFESIVSELRDSLHAGPRRWLGVKEAATYTGLSEGSIKSLLSSGKLTSHRPVRGRVLIDRIELDSVIASSTASIRKGRGIRRG